MASDQPRSERQEIPLAASGLQDVQRIDSDALEDHRQFVDQCDVEITLRVLYDLGRLCYFQAAGLVGACNDDGGIQGIHRIGGFGSAAASDLLDLGQRVDLVAWVDAFRTVSAEEVTIEYPATEALEDRHADFLGSPG